MVVAAAKAHRWDTRHDEQIVSVRYEPGNLIVSFADGSDARVAVDRLSVYGVVEDRWPEAAAEGYHVAVPTDAGSAQIPWVVIRSLSDREFAAHWDKTRLDAGRRTGQRLRDLRESRNLSLPDLAARAGVAETTLRRIEDGVLAADLATTERVLRAMDCSLDALASDG
jgi:DNA-binding XRE family transcriptional regulator